MPFGIAGHAGSGGGCLRHWLLSHRDSPRDGWVCRSQPQSWLSRSELFNIFHLLFQLLIIASWPRIRQIIAASLFLFGYKLLRVESRDRGRIRTSFGIREVRGRSGWHDWSGVEHLLRPSPQICSSNFAKMRMIWSLEKLCRLTIHKRGWFSSSSAMSPLYSNVDSKQQFRTSSI